MDQSMVHNRVGLIVSLIVGIIVGGVGYYFLTERGCPLLQGGGSSKMMNTKRHDFITAMRKLWTDHVVWTRDFIITALADMPDKGVATDRLLENQEDIGHAILPFYGADAGKKLTELLKQHILIAADLVAAAKASNKAKFEEENKKWQDNAHDIAVFLSKANPNWSESMLNAMLNNHLQLTIDETSTRIGKKWQEDVAAFDKVFEQAMKMADALSDGIIKQFPEKFN